MSVGFSGSAIRAAHDLGYDFISVANRSESTADDIRADEEKYGVTLLHIDLCRSPFSSKNFKAYKQLCQIIKENGIDYIHCNTPVGGLLGRLAGKKCRVKKVIYQAHGFHFYKGAPKLNWLLYYPVEKWLARKTDALITINSEDYDLAREKMKLRKGGKVYYIPGVGIDTSAFSPDEDTRKRKREELGLNEEDVMLVTSGNLDPNKNFCTAVRAVAETGDKRVHLYICGKGPEMENLDSLIRSLGVEDNVHLLGYRNDMRDLLCAADAFIMPTFREGLSRSIMEAMASGLPCIVSRIRGNVDLIEEGKGGYLCSATDAKAFANAIMAISSDVALRESMKAENLERIKRFDLSVATESLKKVYDEVLKD